MISRNQGEQLARSLNAVRPDWPVGQLVTLIGELKDYPLRDLGCALMWVALDRNPDGTWKSQSPYRVKEDGPWWEDSQTAGEELQAKKRAVERHEQAMADVQWRTKRIRECRLCDDRGYRDGYLCRHIDEELAVLQAKAHANQARLALREAELHATKAGHK